MSGSVGPMTVCDAECAANNGCEVGGIACEGCGRYFCADEIDAEGYCERCGKEHEDNVEEEDEEGGEEYD